jgi:Zn-dependent M28 family amino/carboxypeptidase
VSEQRRVEAVVNMDMIGSPNTVALGVLLEGAAQAQTVIDGLAESAATYTSLEVQVSLEPFASDHVPFLQASMPAVLTIEAADSANEAVHSAADTPDRVSPELALEILRMNAAFLAQRLEDAA